MKFAPLTLAVTAVVAASAFSVPSFAQSYRDRDRDGYYDNGRYRDYCRDRKKQGQKGGAAVGAVTGAVVGSQVAGRGAKTEGAVLGAVAGAVIGSNVGRSMLKCDDRGAYWSQANTYPYRGKHYRRDRGRYDDRWYENRRCRWAQDYRDNWIRVCPTDNGRYRPVY